MWEKTKAILAEAVERVLASAAGLVPAILAVMAILVGAALLALLVRLALRRLCARIGVDRRAREWGLVAPGAESRPSLLVERLGAWTVLAMGAVLGLTVLESGAPTGLSGRLIGYVPQVLLAVVVVFVGLALSRLAERHVLIGAVNMGLHSARFLGLGARWLVLVLAVAMALEHVGVGGSVLPISFGIVFGGIVLALALAVGLGARDMVARSLERHLGSRREGEEAQEEDDLRHM